MLRRPIRQTHKSGVYVNAVVEEVHHGYATVRLASSGARMTGLSVLGGAVIDGDQVIVDYSAGTPPVVRPITTPYEDDSSLPDSFFGEGIEEIPFDVSFNIYGNSPTTIPKGSWYQVPWADAKFQTHLFLDTNNPHVITIPFDGFYFIHGQAAATGFVDRRPLYDMNGADAEDLFADTEQQKLVAELRHSESGVFGYARAPSMDMYTPAHSTVDAHGMVACAAGDTIGLYLQHTDPYTDTIDMVVDDTHHLYPRIFGMRMTKGGYYDSGSYTYGSTGSGTGPDGGGGWDVEDDSDIEIQTNMGYLHVSEQTNQTYARGIAYVGDFPSLELLLKYRFDDISHGAELRIFIRSSRDWQDWNRPSQAYGMYLSNTGGWGLHRVEMSGYDPISTPLGSVNTNAMTATRWLRFQADGTNIRAKTWLATDSEPGWDLDITDTGGFTDLGGLQLGYFNVTGEHKAYLDDLDLHIP